MTAEQFAYWLQGYAEISQSAPTDEQWAVIQDHLKLVFTKVTPERLPNSSSEPRFSYVQPFDFKTVTQTYC